MLRTAEAGRVAVPTLKEFEEALREQGMRQALRILEALRERDRAERKVARPRRIAGVKMTADLAHRILELHKTTGMTQQEIAFELGVNQGRVNEVIKRGKWLTDDPEAPERLERDKALGRMRKAPAEPAAPKRATAKPKAKRRVEPPQLSLL
jgi:DNA-directed RNA polymerase specialized sigma24 family protein